MDVAFRRAGGADSNLLVQFMREFYEFEHLTFDKQVASSALQKIFSDDSFGSVWLNQVNGSSIGYVVLTLGLSLMPTAPRSVR